MLYKSHRLDFCIMKDKYIPDLHKILVNPKVLKYTFQDSLNTEVKIIDFIQNNFIFSQNKKYGLMPVFLNKTSELIGFCGVLKCDYFIEKDYEMGFILSDKFWNNGYATEMANIQLHIAFSELNLNRIFATVYEDNIGSKKILHNIGFNYLKTIFIKNRGYREIYVCYHDLTPRQSKRDSII